MNVRDRGQGDVMSDSSFEAARLRNLILAMRAAYERGENVMAVARNLLGAQANALMATMIAYDLQAGTYTSARRRTCGLVEPKDFEIAQYLRMHLPLHGRLLEVGCGEATRLAGVLTALGGYGGHAYGFDVSWSRVNEGRNWLAEHGLTARLFLGDLFDIPLADNSMDVVYSSHSLEPNGGREEAAIRECMRVARRAVVLVEPLYELAGPEARRRIEAHGYVRGLKDTADRLNIPVLEYRLLKEIGNPLNPSGVLVLAKQPDAPPAGAENPLWRCPITGALLSDEGDLFRAGEVGMAYPVLRGIPLLRSVYAVVASGLGAP